MKQQRLLVYCFVFVIGAAILLSLVHEMLSQLYISVECGKFQFQLMRTDFDLTCL